MAMRKWLCFVALLALAVTDVSAEQYWVAYEGNDFPENEGWTRFTDGVGAQRAIVDGMFVIDSRESLHIYDYYMRDLQGSLDPGTDETFVLQWRMLIEGLEGWRDPIVGVFSDDSWAVSLEFTDDSVSSGFESGVQVPFEPFVPHEFEFRSSDMRNYELLIDGALTIEGSFWQSLNASRVAWGDGVQGGASLTRWDYMRFGVVPEPGSSVLLFHLMVILHHAAKRNRAVK